MSGYRATQSSTCIPPRLPPITPNRVSIPKWRTSAACTSTMSPTVMNGNRSPYGSPLTGFRQLGPVVPLASSQDIRTDHKVLVGVQSLARTHQTIPPARLPAFGRVPAGHVRIASQRMTDKDGIVLLRGQLAISLVRDSDWPQLLPSFEGQWAWRLKQRCILRFSRSPRSGNRQSQVERSQKPSP